MKSGIIISLSVCIIITGIAVNRVFPAEKMDPGRLALYGLHIGLWIAMGGLFLGAFFAHGKK